MSAVVRLTDEPGVAEAVLPSAALAASTSSRLAECLQETAALHRHVCPRQVLGVRMALHAGELLGLDLPRRDKRLFVLIETDGCLADAVSVASGAWLGHRTLRLVDHGKIAATFVDTETRRALRVWPHPEARIRASERVPDAHDRWHAQLEGYKTMLAEDLLRVAPVTLTIDLDAIRSRPGVRVDCAACREEIVNEREVMDRGRALCRDCAGDPYFRLL